MSFGNILGQLFGGGQNQDYQDFVNRYHQGPPSEGYDNQEVMQRYQQIAPHLPPCEYQQAAEDALARISPNERQQLGQYLLQGAQQQGLNVPGMYGQQGGGSLQDPSTLAQLFGTLQQQQPGLIGQLLGSILGGGTSPYQQSGSSGGIGTLLSSPIAKSALAGIAAMAAQRFLGGGGQGFQSGGGQGFQGGGGQGFQSGGGQDF
jgi:hypothetical protein